RLTGAGRLSLLGADAQRDGLGLEGSEGHVDPHHRQAGGARHVGGLVEGPDASARALAGLDDALELSGLAAEPVQLPAQHAVDAPGLEVPDHALIVRADHAALEAGEVGVLVDIHDLPAAAGGERPAVGGLARRGGLGPIPVAREPRVETNAHAPAMVAQDMCPVESSPARWAGRTAGPPCAGPPARG